LKAIGRVAGLAGAMCITSVALDASAQGYPVRPIRVVVPLAAGGGTDILGRTIAQKLSEGLKQTAFVDNRPGAGGNVGMELVAKAPADGYTLLVASAGLAINPSLYEKLQYNPIRDFAPITLIGSGPFVLVIHPTVPVKSVTQLISLGKSKPNELSFASAGNGSGPHLSAELFKSMSKTQMVHVPYKGGGPALIDLLSGQVSVMFPEHAAGVVQREGGPAPRTWCHHGEAISCSAGHSDDRRSGASRL
jgi:tripartite-type tricarboxylate transporter receptor subunit TctC